MNINNFDFSLPKKNIAQVAKKSRSSSKLLVINRKKNKFTNDKFENIDQYINTNDLIIVNDTKVFPARIFGFRNKTKGKVEILVERILSEKNFICQIKSTRKLKKEDIIIAGKDIKLEIEENNNDFACIKVLNYNVKDLFKNYGIVPLPPYIRRNPDNNDKKYYQTIFADKVGSVAAPTAALHFDNNILGKLKQKRVKVCKLTLHIGMGTFSPIKTENINQHEMHAEFYQIPKTTIEQIKKCKLRKGKVISVGTTVARALESFYSDDSKKPDTFYETNIYIKPGYTFKVVDHLITNFHLPKSSLLVMISAFYSTDKILEAYKFAIENDYKFFSYGDSSIIL